MKNINESFNDIQNLTEYIKDRNVNEGFMDVLKNLKAKFVKAFQYLKSFVVKVGAYFVPASNSGLIVPAISPLTAGAAYNDGYINTNSTFVKMDREGAKITGCKTKFEDALNLYGKGNSISYWMKMINEHAEQDEINAILENYINEHEDDMMSEEIVNEVKLHTEDPEAEYNIIKDDAGLQEMITMCVKNKKLARLLIWGAPGIGKTAILMNVISSLKKDFPDIRLIVKTLSNETPDNFTLPDYVEDMQDDDFANLAKDLNKEESAIRKLYKLIGGRKSVDIPKTWLPVYKPTGDKEVDAYLDAKCGDGLLFIDELSRASSQVLNVMLPLINEGIFNGYKLGSGWTIVCASNRMSDEESGQTQIGNALANRFLQVHYEPTVESWREWADKQNFISPLLLQWLSLPEKETMSGGKFYYMDPNEDSSRIADTTLMCTPRSWTNAMRLLAGFHHTGTLEGFKIFDIPQNIIRKALNSAVPKTAVDSFMSFLQVIEEIGDFDKAVYDVWNNGGANFKLDKKSLNKITLPMAQLICTAHADSLPTKEEWENLCKWIVAQNSDQLASYVLDVFGNVFVGDVEKEIRPALFTVQPRIRKFSSTNPAKLNAIKQALSPVLQKWGVKFEDVPDYSEGLKNLVDKYGKSFKSAVVGDHIDALG